MASDGLRDFALLADKVDVVSGGLSTNDFTGTYRRTADAAGRIGGSCHTALRFPTTQAGSTTDYHLTVGSDWVYLYKKGAGHAWRLDLHRRQRWVSETNIATFAVGQADVNATLDRRAAATPARQRQHGPQRAAGRATDSQPDHRVRCISSGIKSNRLVAAGPPHRLALAFSHHRSGQRVPVGR